MLEMQMPDVAVDPAATPVPAPAGPAFMDGLVSRLSEDFHVDPDVVALHATSIVRQRYAAARVQSFIPILVERELRALLRAGRAGGVTAG